jgi:archaellum component FlaC
MFKNLTNHLQSLSSNADNISNQIENELEKLHDKRAKRIEEINNLQSILPRLKHTYQSLIKAFGYSENDLVKDDVINAKKTIIKAVEDYKRLEASLKEIEQSIEALESEQIELI